MLLARQLATGAAYIYINNRQLSIRCLTHLGWSVKATDDLNMLQNHDGVCCDVLHQHTYSSDCLNWCKAQMWFLYVALLLAKQT